MLTKITDKYWIDLSLICKIEGNESGYEIQMKFPNSSEIKIVNNEIGELISKALIKYYYG